MSAAAPIPFQEFSKQIKEKYPQYKDKDDRELAQAMVDKFPVYKGRVRFDEAQTQAKPAGRSLDFLLSHNVKRTPAEEEMVQKHLHAHKSGGLEELGGAMGVGLVGGPVAAGEGLLKTLGTAAYKTATGAAGGAIGYEAGKRGAKMLGLPEGAATGVGVITSILGGRLGMKLNPGDLGKFLEETESPTIGKFLKWMKQQGKPPAVEEPKPEAPEPFKPSAGTARSMKYGGPAEPDYSAPSGPVKRQFGTPAKKLKITPPGAPEPEPEVVPKAPKPFKPNPAVARKMKFGGTREPDYTAPPVRVKPGARPTATARTAGGGEAAVESTPSGQTAGPATEQPAHPGHEAAMLRARAATYDPGTAKRMNLANRFAGQGLTPEQVEAMPNEKFEVQMLAEGQAQKARGMSKTGYKKYSGRPQETPYNIMKIEVANAMRAMARKAAGQAGGQ